MGNMRDKNKDNVFSASSTLIIQKAGWRQSMLIELKVWWSDSDIILRSIGSWFFE